MQITYKDKVTLQSNSNIPDENKVTAEDMNEIKSVVNSNEEEQQALNMSVQEIAQNVVNNSQEISNIKEEQTTQNDNIQTNSNNISDLQSNKADKNEIPTDLSQLSNENTKFVNETGLENAISQEKTQRQNADNNLQNQVDTNKTNIQTNATNIATNTQEINTIKAEQTTQNNRLNNLETDNTTNKDNISANTQEINNIKSEQTTQNTNISTNATNIESLQSENENLKKIVSQLPQVTGQGTEITLENTIEAQFTIFDVEGNSTQDGEPSPDNEQPIESAGDNENLFDGELELGTIGSTGANNNSTTDMRSKNYVSVDEQETYTISSNIGTNASLRFYDTNKTFISTMSGSAMPRTFSTPENAKYLRFVIPNTTDINAKVKLEKSTQATPYSPYGMGSINEKIQTRNLVDGVLDNSLSATAKLITKDMNVLVPAGTYTISFTNKPNQSNGNIYSGSTNILNIPWYSDKKTFTLTETTLITRITCDVGANQIVYAQLEPGSTATPYVEHKEQDYSIFVQQPMMDDDHFDRKNNKEVHTWIKYVLDGSNDENWSIRNNKFFINDNVNYNSWERVISPNGKSNIGVVSYSVLDNQTGFGLALAYGIRLNLENINAASGGTVEQLRTYLAEHPITIYVKLKEGAYEKLPCTPEQIQQLENLPSTYKDFTIIQSEDETPAYLEVSGIYDLNKLITRTEVLESEV